MNTHNPEISVIMPTYNRARHIEMAIESVLIQNCPMIEIMVIDDGSTDDTFEYLRKYIDKNIITYIRQDNKGPAAARNNGIIKSRGEYICFLDSDDVINPDSIKDRLYIYKKYPELGLIFSDTKKIIRKNGEDIVFRENDLLETGFIDSVPSNCISLVEGNFYLFTKDIFNELILRGFIWTGTVMIKRNVFSDVGYFREDIRISEDQDLWLRIARKYSIGYLNKSTAIYMMHGGSITKNIPLFCDCAAKVRAQYMDDLPTSYRAKLRKQLADYSFKKGYYYYEKELFSDANIAFRQALGCNPMNINCILYSMLTLFPDIVIKNIRRIKRSLSS